jgi:hypothetical protein
MSNARAGEVTCVCRKHVAAVIEGFKTKVPSWQSCREARFGVNLKLITREIGARPQFKALMLSILVRAWESRCLKFFLEYHVPESWHGRNLDFEVYLQIRRNCALDRAHPATRSGLVASGMIVIEN